MRLQGIQLGEQEIKDSLKVVDFLVKKEKEINESIKSYRAMYQTAKENVQMLERIANSMLSQSDKLKELDIDPATIQSIKDQARKHLDVANRLNKLISKTTANF